MHEHKDTNVQIENSNSDGFAGRISELINEAGGYAEFARSCGVSESVARKWSKGGSDPSRLNLIAIAKARNVNLLWLAMGEGEKFKTAKPAYLKSAAEIGREQADKYGIPKTLREQAFQPDRSQEDDHYTVKRVQTPTREPPLDLQLLQEVIENLEAHLMFRGKILTPARKALFIQLIYEHQMDKRFNKDETTEKFLQLLDE
jgi:transcriptional regulator with XRE-family HTH domain